MENCAQTTKFGKFTIFINLFEIAPPLRFQRALNDYSHFYKTRGMPILLFLTQNAQIWKIGPRPPNLGKFLFFLILLKLPHHYASNEPSTTTHTFIILKLCQFYCFDTKSLNSGGNGIFLHILHY